MPARPRSLTTRRRAFCFSDAHIVAGTKLPESSVRAASSDVGKGLRVREVVRLTTTGRAQVAARFFFLLSRLPVVLGPQRGGVSKDVRAREVVCACHRARAGSPKDEDIVARRRRSPEDSGGA